MHNRLLSLYTRNRATQNRACIFSLDPSADEATVYLYDVVVSDESEAEWFGGIAPLPFVREIAGLKASKINLRINSPGGSVFAARAIEQALREHPARIVAHVDGLAASAATFIAMAADEVVMAPGAMWMIHKAWGLAMGNSDDMTAMAALLDKLDTTLIGTYAARTKQDPERIGEWMAAETWFTAEETLAAGFADSIAEPPSSPQDRAPSGKVAWDLTAFALPRPSAAASIASTIRRVTADRAALLRKLEAATLGT